MNTRIVLLKSGNGGYKEKDDATNTDHSTLAAELDDIFCSKVGAICRLVIVCVF